MCWSRNVRPYGICCTRTCTRPRGCGAAVVCGPRSASWMGCAASGRTRRRDHTCSRLRGHGAALACGGRRRNALKGLRVRPPRVLPRATSTGIVLKARVRSFQCTLQKNAKLRPQAGAPAEPLKYILEMINLSNASTTF